MQMLRSASKEHDTNKPKDPLACCKKYFVDWKRSLSKKTSMMVHTNSTVILLLEHSTSLFVLLRRVTNYLWHLRVCWIDWIVSIAIHSLSSLLSPTIAGDMLFIVQMDASADSNIMLIFSKSPNGETSMSSSTVLVDIPRRSANRALNAKQPAVRMRPIMPAMAQLSTELGIGEPVATSSHFWT